MLVVKLTLVAALLWTGSHSNASSIDLKSVVAEKLKKSGEEIKAFRKNHGSEIVTNVTVDMMYRGMRGINAIVTETSELDPERGILFRGLTITECYEKLPKAQNSNELLPEALFWLLITGEIPTSEQAKWVSKTWAERAKVPSHVMNMLNKFPVTVHPMIQLVSAVAMLSTESKFVEAYHNDKVDESEYWKYIYEDSMDLIGKLPVIAATIYKNLYRDREKVASIDTKLDWSTNFTSMLGFNNTKEEFVDFMRLFLSIHSDHEGGNVSAHTTHLVGSALSDPYLSFSAGMAGLAGPLHGLANQEVWTWLKKLEKEITISPSKEELEKFIKETMDSGQVIPGYGHAVLRITDPRYTCQRKFALKHLPDDEWFKLVSQLEEVVPDVLLSHYPKVKNPFPNVDAHSAVLLQYYGFKETEFYTVLFGVSRALGVLASLVWDRGLNLPIERPKSWTTEELIKKFTEDNKP